MSNLYQTNFNKNISINQRSKRFRHLTAISVHNLQINAQRFNVWLTFHSFPSNNAYYITDKKENNNTNPKFTLNTNKLKNSNILSSKEFVIRLWYSDLDKSPGDRLCLLMEAEVNLDSLIRLNDENFKYSVKNFNNILVFEIFGYNFCEPLGFPNDDEQTFSKAVSKIREVPMKNSYSFNLMVRLHDFQRVIHETLFKINQLKNTSMIKFDASSRLRALQVKKEKQIQKINLYKIQLKASNERIDQLTDYNNSLRLITKNKKEKLNAFKQQHPIDTEKLKERENKYNTLVKMNQLIEFKLKQRQKNLIAELAKIFCIESRIEIVPSSNETNLQAKTRLKILSLQFNNLSNNLANSNDDKQNSIVLGYITHAIQMLITILNVPLRYPIMFRGSKSFIIEQIKEDNICETPLFRQNNSSGQDQAYNHGVELLSKNLSHLRGLYESYKTADQKDLLANLKWIFDFFIL